MVDKEVLTILKEMKTNQLVQIQVLKELLNELRRKK